MKKRNRWGILKWPQVGYFKVAIREQMKDLAKLDANPELASVKTTLLLIHWMFDTSLLSGYGFPFDMKHLLFYQRLIAG